MNALVSVSQQSDAAPNTLPTNMERIFYACFPKNLTSMKYRKKDLQRQVFFYNPLLLPHNGNIDPTQIMKIFQKIHYSPNKTQYFLYKKTKSLDFT